MKKKNRVQGGNSTSNVIMSAHVHGNLRWFPQILSLRSQILLLPMLPGVRVFFGEMCQMGYMT